MKPAKSFVVFSQDFLQLSPRQTRALWHAMTQSEVYEPQTVGETGLAPRLRPAYEMRCGFLLHDALANQLDFTGLVDKLCGPTRFTAMLEDLIAQKLLSRAEANALEEHILRLTTQNGSWPAQVPLPEGYENVRI